MGADLKKIVSDIIFLRLVISILRMFPAGMSRERARSIGRQSFGSCRDQGYTGYVGFEYFPKDESDSSLEAIRKLWEASVR